MSDSELLALAVAMREAQREYYLRHRLGKPSRLQLAHAKRLEGDFDREIANRRGLVRQGDLLGDSLAAPGAYSGG